MLSREDQLIGLICLWELFLGSFLDHFLEYFGAVFGILAFSVATYSSIPQLRNTSCEILQYFAIDDIIFVVFWSIFGILAFSVAEYSSISQLRNTSCEILQYFAIDYVIIFRKSFRN